MKRFSGDWTDTALLVCLLAFTLIFVVAATHYSAEARLFPVAVSCVMLGLLAVELASRFETDWSRALRRRVNPASASALGTYPRRKQLAALTWVALSALLFWLAGILVAVAMYVFSSLKIRGHRSWMSSAAVAAGATLAIWLLFSVALKIELYRGIWGGGS